VGRADEQGEGGAAVDSEQPLPAEQGEEGGPVAPAGAAGAGRPSAEVVRGEDEMRSNQPHVIDALVAVLLGLLAAQSADARQVQQDDRRDPQARVGYVVLGLGVEGPQLGKTLARGLPRVRVAEHVEVPAQGLVVAPPRALEESLDRPEKLVGL
jgi:hypothetical protein